MADSQFRCGSVKPHCGGYAMNLVCQSKGIYNNSINLWKRVSPKCYAVL